MISLGDIVAAFVLLGLAIFVARSLRSLEKPGIVVGRRTEVDSADLSEVMRRRK